MNTNVSHSMEESRSIPEPGEASFHTAMAHLYRGEMHRMTIWRQRLDVTGNWAILLVVALITFTLGAPDVPHFTLLLGLALIGISALIEGRRYRHLHHSGWRLYLMEQGYYAKMLCLSSESRVANWQKALADDLQRPRLLISWFTGTRVRLRRNYLMIVYFVAAAWITKLFIHPGRPNSVKEFMDRFAVGDIIPPWLVILSGFAFVGGVTGLAISCPASEKIEKWHGAFERGMHECDEPARKGGSSPNGDSPIGDR